MSRLYVKNFTGYRRIFQSVTGGSYRRQSLIFAGKKCSQEVSLLSMF
jgi:hypothetical protein